MSDSNGGIDWGKAPDPITSEYFFQNFFTFNSARPVVVQTHLKPAWNIIAERWPTFKLVYITHTAEDLNEIAANLFYKYYLDEFDTVSKQAFFEILNQQAPNAFARNITSPADMTPEEIQLFMKIVVFHKITDGYMYPEIPEKYASQVLKLPYREIASNKETTLQKLSAFMETSIPETASQNYDAYLLHQQKILTEKATWVKPYDY
jgi:hypothetical protein